MHTVGFERVDVEARLQRAVRAQNHHRRLLAGLRSGKFRHDTLHERVHLQPRVVGALLLVGRKGFRREVVGGIASNDCGARAHPGTFQSALAAHEALLHRVNDLQVCIGSALLSGVFIECTRAVWNVAQLQQHDLAAVAELRERGLHGLCARQRPHAADDQQRGQLRMRWNHPDGFGGEVLVFGLSAMGGFECLGMPGQAGNVVLLQEAERVGRVVEARFGGRRRGTGRGDRCCGGGGAGFGAGLGCGVLGGFGGAGRLDHGHSRWVGMPLCTNKRLLVPP